jgi:hypothetical protein
MKQFNDWLSEIKGGKVQLDCNSDGHVKCIANVLLLIE